MILDDPTPQDVTEAPPEAPLPDEAAPAPEQDTAEAPETPDGPDETLSDETLSDATLSDEVVPARPEDYRIAADDLPFAPDPDANRAMHEAGLTHAQAGAVYRMAAEFFLPAVEEATAALARQDEERQLVDHFGGEAAWRRTAGQLRAWGERHLPADALALLAESRQGCLALHAMMRAAEQGGGETLGAGPGTERVPETLDGVKAMMRDPAYWRDHDPGLIARVSEGFRRHFGR